MPCQLGLAALPRAGPIPIETASCLPPATRGLAETRPRSLLRDTKEPELLRAELGLVTPFSDPALVRHAARQVNFCIKPVRRE